MAKNQKSYTPYPQWERDSLQHKTGSAAYGRSGSAASFTDCIGIPRRERYRFFLSDEGYQNARASEGRGEVKIRSHAAAYRSGTKLTNKWDGLTHDYTRKGGIIHSAITPSNRRMSSPRLIASL